MSLDKFGRSSASPKKQIKRKYVDHIFPLTSDGNYDIGNRTLSNVKTCSDKKDAATKDYVDGLMNIVNSRLTAFEVNGRVHNKTLKALDDRCSQLKNDLMVTQSSYKDWTNMLKAHEIKVSSLDNNLADKTNRISSLTNRMKAVEQSFEKYAEHMRKSLTSITKWEHNEHDQDMRVQEAFGKVDAKIMQLAIDVDKLHTRLDEYDPEHVDAHNTHKLPIDIMNPRNTSDNNSTKLPVDV